MPVSDVYRDFDGSRRFRIRYDTPSIDGFSGAVAYGKLYPEFWVQIPVNGDPAAVGNGSHIGFIAPSRDAVLGFHEAGLAAGAADEGEPGPREEYGAPYFGCFLRDLDGHKIEAVFWDFALAEKLGIG